MNRFRRPPIIVGSTICAVVVFTAAAHGEPVRYEEGFETDNPVRHWTSKGNYTVHYAGLTNQRSRSGERAFKLDVTFVADGDYNYWSGPILDIPAVKGMRLSGHIYLEQVPPNVSVGIGTSYYVPALEVKDGGAGRGVCHIIGTLGRESTGKWIEQQADLGIVGENLGMKVLGESSPGIRMEKWAIQVFCRNAVNARLVLYIDDVTVKGDVPPQWEETAAQHLLDWQIAFRARQDVSASQFRAALAPLHAQAAVIAASIPSSATIDNVPVQPWREHAQALCDQMHRDVKAALQTTDPAQPMPPDAEAYLHDIGDRCLRPLRLGAVNLRRLKGRTAPCLVYVQNNPLTNYRTLPRTALADGLLDESIELVASPGEYEPSAICLRPARDPTVALEVSNLVFGEQVIPGEAIDLRVVKAWYQAGRAVSETDQRILMPELLLHDDTLVEVDESQRCNIVRDIDAPRDADVLLPVDIKAGQVRQFWLTVRVPAAATPGKYAGTLKIQFSNLPCVRVPIRLDVLPIDLKPSYLDYGLYYRAQLTDGTPAAVNSDFKTAAQIEADLRNMKAHGILWPDIYERCPATNGTVDFSRLDRQLQIRRKVGLPVDPMLYLGVGTGGLTDERLVEQRLKLIQSVIDFARSRGIEQVYFYGQDEAMGEALRSQRRVWSAIHGMGGRVWVACSTGFFDVVGDLLDLPVVARQSPADVPRVHAAGRKIWNYAKPGPIEAPFSQRYYMGWWLIRSGMDGSHAYAFQHALGKGKSGGRPWDDFDDAVYRSINYTYPTVDGVVDTLQWEAVREAIDDVRYYTTLRDVIDQTAGGSDRRARALAADASRWLDSLDITGDLQAIRREMAQRIVELNATHR